MKYSLPNCWLKIICPTLLLLASLTLLPSPAISDYPDIQAVVSYVLDGDTIVVKLNGESSKTTIRLIGVDTPERSFNSKTTRDSEASDLGIKQIIKLGNKSYQYMKKLLPKGTLLTLRFDVQKFDPYDRMLVYAYLPDGRMINTLVVEAGYAQPYTVPPDTKFAHEFEAAAKRAQKNKVGLWAD